MPLFSLFQILTGLFWNGNYFVAFVMLQVSNAIAQIIFFVAIFVFCCFKLCALKMIIKIQVIFLCNMQEQIFKSLFCYGVVVKIKRIKIARKDAGIVVVGYRRFAVFIMYYIYIYIIDNFYIFVTKQNFGVGFLFQMFDICHNIFHCMYHSILLFAKLLAVQLSTPNQIKRKTNIRCILIFLCLGVQIIVFIVTHINILAVQVGSCQVKVHLQKKLLFSMLKFTNLICHKNCFYLVDKSIKIKYAIKALCEHGEIGRRAGLRIQWATVGVQVPLLAPSKQKRKAKRLFFFVYNDISLWK